MGSNSGAVIACNAAIIASIAASNAAAYDDEIQEYNYVVKNLDAIVARGRDETKWCIECQADDLPEKSKWKIEKWLGLKRVYKGLDESVKDYFSRVFKLADLYQHNGELIADLGILCLHFGVEDLGQYSAKRDVTLFTPEYSDCQRITRPLEVRTHRKRLTYKGFSEGDFESYARVAKPDWFSYI